MNKIYYFSKLAMTAASIRLRSRGVSILLITTSSLIFRAIAFSICGGGASAVLSHHASCNTNDSRTQSCNRSSASIPDLDLDSLLVTELKEMLRERGLKVGGRKAELIERLRQNGGNSDSLADGPRSSKRRDISDSAAHIPASKTVPIDGIVIEAGKS